MRLYRSIVRPAVAFASFILAGALTACASAVPSKQGDSGEFSLLSFNIHYISPSQTSMVWDDRKAAVAAVLKEADADIMAFQEMETFMRGDFSDQNLQRDWVAAHFPDYGISANGDPRHYPFTQPIFYRLDRFEALEQGFFFFSETPELIYSRSWDGRFPAFCSWTRLRDKRTGRSFYLYNIHLDHASLGNRIKAARLIARRIAEREHQEDAVLVAGDFNAPAAFRPLRIVAASGLTLAPRDGGTFHFNRGIRLMPAIDHILYSKDFVHFETKTFSQRYEGVWPSDHYPVLARLSYAARQGSAR
jgi:endonuclease/exonuclease/phosphatase family metal-dependent hydrolase